MSALPLPALVERLAPAVAAPQPAWLRSLRGRALHGLRTRGFPTRKQEDWKYTRVDALLETDYRPAGAQCLGLVPEDIEHLFTDDQQALRMVFVNGRFAPQLSRLRPAQHDVDIDNLACVLAQRPQVLKGRLGQLANGEAHAFDAMNTAGLSDGLYLHVGAGVEMSRALHLLYLTTGTGVLVLPRNLVVLEAGAHARIIEHYAALGEADTLTDAVGETLLGEEASLVLYKLQMENPAASHLASHYLSQDRASRLVTHLVSLGGRLVRSELHTRLQGRDAESELRGLYLAGRHQHMDFHTGIEHAAPNCRSRQDYRGVLDDKAHGVFDGRVRVLPDAQSSDARQVNDTLLLSAGAEMDTKPQLEIFADDVQCSHGATVGELDTDSLFYLRSRGLDEPQARAMLVRAFLAAPIDGIGFPPVRRWVDDQVDRCLAGRPGAAGERP